jgi:hypothetical protein
MAYNLYMDNKKKEDKYFEVPKEEKKPEKKDPKKLFLEDLKKKDTITESEILLVKRRLNDGTYKYEDIEDLNEKNLTPEQTEKRLKYLKNKGWGKTGKQRTTSPYGQREEQALETFEKFEFGGFTDDTNSYQIQSGIHNYQPIYYVIGKDGTFEYYMKAGEPYITG